MARFLQTLDDSIFELLKEEAARRGVSVQDLIRVEIIPYWVRTKLKRES